VSVGIRRRALAASAVATAAALTASACGPLPPPPPGALPPTAIPTIESTLAFEGPTTNDGFTPQQHTAVRLRVADCQGWGNGSGFILNENQIITNKHVIDGATHIEVTTYDGRDFVATASQVAPLADLAIVTLDTTFTDIVELSDRTLAVGDPVTIVGYPEGQALEVEDGFFVTTELDDVGDTGEYVDIFNAHTLPGNSGSAVFDEDGKVVSILYSSDTLRSSGAWNVSWLKELIADPSLWQPNPAPC
jgi:S1-C subfamily serine protease